MAGRTSSRKTRCSPPCPQSPVRRPCCRTRSSPSNPCTPACWRSVGRYPDLDQAVRARIEDVLAQLVTNGWLVTAEHLVIGPGADGPATVYCCMTELGADPTSDLPSPGPLRARRHPQLATRSARPHLTERDASTGIRRQDQAVTTTWTSHCRCGGRHRGVLCRQVKSVEELRSVVPGVTARNFAWTCWSLG